MKYLIIVILLTLLSFGTAGRADALEGETVPYQFSLFHPLQTTPETASVKGLRVNLVNGKNRDVSGLDMGFFNFVSGEQKGVQIGFYNSTFKSSGLQLGLFNKTEYLDGLQIGILNIHGEGHFKMLPVVNFAF